MHTEDHARGDVTIRETEALSAPVTTFPPTPPVPAQPAAPLYARQLQSEKVVVAAPLSFVGSAARIWKLVRLREEAWERALLALVAILLIVVVWTLVLAWYLLWGLWLVPYRVVRRGSRKRKRQALQHREMIAAIQGQHHDPRGARNEEIL